MNNLANLYFNGNGVPKDYTQARQWYEKAAAAGNVPAMNSLGWIYDNGFGVPQNYGQARNWFEKAAAGGDTHAMVNLADLYRDGHGVVKDIGAARQWYQKAAAAGNDAASDRLKALNAGNKKWRLLNAFPMRAPAPYDPTSRDRRLRRRFLARIRARARRDRAPAAPRRRAG
jgi:TPR repeat protein